MNSTKIPYFPLPNVHSSASASLKITHLRTELRRIMWEDVGIVRSRRSLTEAVRGLRQLGAKINSIPGASRELLELKNMLTAAELITHSAQKRRESLGCHYRID